MPVHCAVCGLPLKVSESIRRGIGPVCYKKLLEMDDADKLMEVDETIKHICPFCGVSVAKPGTSDNSYSGMLALHIKHKHPDVWRGFLDATMEAVRRDAQLILSSASVEKWEASLAQYDAAQLAGTWRIMAPIYHQLLMEEPSPRRNDLVVKLQALRDAVTYGGVKDHYDKVMKEWQ